MSQFFDMEAHIVKTFAQSIFVRYVVGHRWGSSLLLRCPLRVAKPSVRGCYALFLDGVTGYELNYGLR